MSVKISGLPAGSTPTGVELIPAVQSGLTVSLTATQLASLAQTGLSGVDSGLANAYVITTPEPLPALSAGQLIYFTPQHPNNTASTANVDGKGVVAIVDSAGNALTGGEISGPTLMEWTGAQWQLLWMLPLANKRTPAEIAALVTPTNYAYAPGIPIDPRRYGMKADGATNDYTAYNSALLVAAQSGGYVVLPAGTILIGSAITHPANVKVVGAGPGITSLKRNFSGDFITSMGAYATLQDLTIDGNAGSGNGIDVVSGGNQAWINVQITNLSGHCVVFSANAGSNSIMLGGACFTSAPPGTLGAIQVNGTDSAAVPRCFIGVESGGCTLYDFGGCNDLFVSGGYSNGLIFGAASSKVSISNFRIGAAGAAVTINGSVHQFVNVVTATPFIVNGSNHTLNITPTIGWGTVYTDNSTGSLILIKQASYTPSLTNVTLGNGTIVGEYSRSGNYITVDGILTLGSTSSVTGTIQIGLPFAPYAFGQFIVGHALLQHGGTFQIAAAVSNPAVSYVTFAPHAATGSANATIPWTWGNGDYIQFHIVYQVP